MKSHTESFWERVDKTDAAGCWLWTGYRRRDGYGAAYRDRLPRLVHRESYEMLVGPIPDGLTLDHLCRVRHCLNPAHLEPVTRGENVLRGFAPSAINSRKTHCDSGHEFTEANTRVEQGWRRCRTCGRERQRRYLDRKKAA